MPQAQTVDFDKLAAQFGGATADALPEGPKMGAAVNIGGKSYPPEYFDTPDPSGTSLGSLLDDPQGTIQRIKESIGTDLQDPKLWAGAVLAYLLPKAASAAPAALRVAKQVATPGMAKDLAQAALGEGRVTAGARAASRVADAVKAGRVAEPAASPAAEPVAAQPPPSAPRPTPKSTSAASPRPGLKEKLSSSEFREVQRMMKRGMEPEAALRSVLGQRAFAKRFGLPDAETVRASVVDRNATGRWPEE